MWKQQSDQPQQEGLQIGSAAASSSRIQPRKADRAWHPGCLVADGSATFHDLLIPNLPSGKLT